MKSKTTKLSLMALAAMSLSANAALVVPTVSAVSSQVTGVNRLAVNTVNGSGLGVGADTVLGTADDTHGTVATDGWLTGTGANGYTAVSTGFITLDLGAVLNVQNLLVWNYNEFDGATNYTTHGMKNVTIEGAGADGIFDVLQNAVFAQGTGAGELAQTFALTGFNGIQFVKITNSTNYGGNRAGLAEVRFEAVPEPSAALLGGLGMLALLRRRRA